MRASAPDRHHPRTGVKPRFARFAGWLRADERLTQGGSNQRHDQPDLPGAMVTDRSSLW